jgi:2-oxoglutarate ferredoxin oxidoreductase subunit gamma
MITATIFAGFGGQGVLLMGYVLAHGAMHKGVNVAYFPAYGAEMRGGTANCTVTMSEKVIASPVASRPDFLVAMNNPSLCKFEPTVKSHGIIFIDESLISEEVQREDVTVVRVPLRELAREVGSDRQANMIMIGAFTAKTGLLTLEETFKGMEKALQGKDKYFAANRAAIQLGTNFILSGNGRI